MTIMHVRGHTLSYYYKPWDNSYIPFYFNDIDTLNIHRNIEGVRPIYVAECCIRRFFFFFFFKYMNFRDFEKIGDYVRIQICLFKITSSMCYDNSNFHLVCIVAGKTRCID